MNSVSLGLNAIGDEDDPLVRIRREDAPCRLDRLCDVCGVARILIYFQPRLLDFSELQFRIRCIPTFQCGFNDFRSIRKRHETCIC